jgi:chorismate mutase/prephenate dehydratase
MTSLLIALGEAASSHSGSLLQMLQPFDSRGISLSKIESRPTKLKAWDYYFFVDVMGHYDEPLMREAVGELQKFCPMVKWLGSYPVAG